MKKFKNTYHESTRNKTNMKPKKKKLLTVPLIVSVTGVTPKTFIGLEILEQPPYKVTQGNTPQLNL